MRVAQAFLHFEIYFTTPRFEFEFLYSYLKYATVSLKKGYCDVITTFQTFNVEFLRDQNNTQMAVFSIFSRKMYSRFELVNAGDDDV